MERLTGIGVSPGIGVGRAVVLTQRAEVMRFPIPPDRVDREIAALRQAQAVSREQLHDISRRIGEGPGGELAALFDAQLLILDDPMLVGRAEELIRSERVNAAWAVHRAYEELCRVFLGMEDPYLRERETDVADVAGRLRLNLRHGATGPRELLSQLDGPSILIADELTASLAAQLDWSRVQGFATDAGSRTYHTAILARSLHIPAIVGLHDASQRIAAGTPVILDGRSGELIVDPSPAQIDDARWRSEPRQKTRAGAVASGPVSTKDGLPIRLEANIELIEDLPTLHEHGAEGVGLYRSEFMLSGRSPDAVSEEAQYRALPEPRRARRADARHHPHLRRRRAPVHAPSRSGAPEVAAWTARPAPRPGPARRPAHSASRAGASRGARLVARDVPVRHGRRRDSRSARDAVRRTARGRRRRPAVGRGDDRGAGRSPDRGSPRPRSRLLHDRHQRPDSGTASPSIVPTTGSRTATSRSIRRCCA